MQIIKIIISTLKKKKLIISKIKNLSKGGVVNKIDKILMIIIIMIIILIINNVKKHNNYHHKKEKLIKKINKKKYISK